MNGLAIGLILVVFLIIALCAAAMRHSYDKISYTLLGFVGGLVMASIITILIFS